MTERRIGKVRIPRELLVKKADIVHAILSGFIVLRAEMLFHSDEMEYILEGSAFDSISLGMEPPEYTIELKITRVT